MNILEMLSTDIERASESHDLSHFFFLLGQQIDIHNKNGSENGMSPDDIFNIGLPQLHERIKTYEESSRVPVSNYRINLAKGFMRILLKHNLYANNPVEFPNACKPFDNIFILAFGTEPNPAELNSYTGLANSLLPENTEDVGLNSHIDNVRNYISFLHVPSYS